MNVIIGIFVAGLGMIIGSFLNAVLFRLHHGISLWGYSACPNCRHRLGAKDLIPVFSYLLLGGRCRYCRKEIAWSYPAVEAASAILFLLIWLRFPSNEVLISASAAGMLGLQWAIGAILLLIFVFDLRYYLIPDSLVAAGAAAAFFLRSLDPGTSLLDGAAGAVLVSGFFGILYYVSDGKWIGLGDVKLGIFLGLILGFGMSLAMLLLAYVSGAVIGVALVILRKKNMQSILPFGTFLTPSAFVVMLWGRELVDWYLSIFS